MTRQDEITISRGSAWNPLAEIEEDGVAKDCTNYDSVLVIKKEDIASSPVVLAKKITWTTRNQGKGKFGFTKTETAGLTPRRYWYEAYIYDLATGEESKPYAKGRLKVEETLSQEPDKI